MARPVDPQRSAARREAIVLAAAQLFAQHGFESTTAAQVAKAAGMSPGSVFYYFEDKRAVFRAIFERDLPQSRLLIDRALAEPEPLAALLAVVDELAAETMDPLAAGLMVELLRQVGHDEALAATILENTAIITDGMAELIRRAVNDGLIDPALEPYEAAQWIQTIVDGAFLSADPGRDPRPMLRRIVSRFLAPPNEKENNV